MAEAKGAQMIERKSGRQNKGNGAAIQFLRDHANNPDGECLIWPFSKTRGYGHFSLNGRLDYAHRFMCELANGPPPSGDHHAAHSCGRGENGCVHPRHVSWKTPSENELDKRAHGTSRGVTSDGVRYKLTPDQVREIRGLRGKMTQDKIAAKFGVSRRNIGMIQTGRSWPTGERRIGTSPSAIRRQKKAAALLASR